MILFKVLWGIDAMAALIVLYFFFVGISDGTVSVTNIGLWTLIVGAVVIIMLGSIWLRHHGHNGLGVALLCVLALPALFYLIYIVAAILGNGRWN